MAQPCHYCGLPADTIDHTIPQHLIARVDYSGIDIPDSLLTVPACRECNVLIGGSVFATVDERARYLKSRLRKRYRSVLKTPVWSTGELEEMSDKMREYISSAAKARKCIEDRLAW
jgi:5-methylcytosine-specific restriction endonuclease McrA